MPPKITRAQLKWAWLELDRLASGWEPSRINRHLTAATALGLQQYRDQIRWIQKPPPHTVLEIVDHAVLLTFDPESPVGIEAELDPATEAQLRHQVESGDELTKALQCLGLNALAGDIEWTQDPPFP